MSSATLQLDELTVRYGGVCAVDSVNLEVHRGQLVGLIGPNGAGKTSLIDAVTGFTPCTGKVYLQGQDISKRPPYLRARAGLGRTWQSAELFEDLTVEENLVVAASRRSWRDVVAEVTLGHQTIDPAVRSALEIMELQALAGVRPSELSEGQRKLVGVARVLAAAPQIICLDEPAAGLDSQETEQLGLTLRKIVEHGTPILLIDHDMSLVMGVSDTVYVLDFGVTIAHGPPADLARDSRVMAAYLGGADEQPGTKSSAHGAESDARRRTVPMDSAEDNLLAVADLHGGYEGVPVLHGINLEVRAGEILAIIGANGVGKTTLLRAISGTIRPTHGSVIVAGKELAGRSANVIAKAGIAHVPEGRGLFYGLTVAQHFRLVSERGHMTEALEEFPELVGLRDRKAGLLSGGEQQMLAMALALFTRPRVLLLDELSLGLAPIVVERLLRVVRRLADKQGTAVVLVEQHVQLGLGIADRGVVMSRGHIVQSGEATDLLADRDTIASSYIGTSARYPAGDQERETRMEHSPQ